MSCAGNCTLCNLPRDKVCKCFVRAGRVVDAVHPSLKVAEDFIATTRYFGTKSREQAYLLIEFAYTEARQRLAANDFDSWEFKQLSDDCVRLRRSADGKLYATRQSMAEAQQTTQTNRNTVKVVSSSTLELWRARRAANQSQQAT